MFKTFGTIVLAGGIGTTIGALMGTVEAVTLGGIFCVAASTAYIVRALEQLRE